MSELIDTTEMYLRTVYELTEERILPMRARIAERLGQSGPTVSQTVGRMQRDGLVELDQEDRHIVLTPVGAEAATRVMRKHRLAECLLVQIIGLPWENVHAEACRWEHVMSDEVERRLVDLLGGPRSSPFGNPIPGLEALGVAPGSSLRHPAEQGDQAQPMPDHSDLPLPGTALSSVVREGEPVRVRVVRIAESLQSEESIMADLRRLGAMPGGEVEVLSTGGMIKVGDALELSPALARQIMVALT